LTLTLVGSLSTFTACNSNTSNETPTAEVQPQTATLTLNAGITGKALQGKNVKAPMGEPSDITIVTVDVESNSTTHAKARNLSKGSEGWDVTLKDLPLGEELVFTLHGYNSAKEEIFKGVESVTLTQKVTNLGMNMYVLDDGEVITIPKLSNVNIVNDNQIDFVVEDSQDGAMFYTITTDSNGLEVNSSTGTIDIINGTATLNMPVTPTLNVGTYTHTIALENAQGSKLESNFMTRVISEVNFQGNIVNIAPVVIAIDRNGNELVVDADVVDDQNISELTYDWSFTNKTFSDNTTNPATLINFSDGTVGTLTLAVSDAQGATTTVTYAVASNQFPDITAPQITSVTPLENATNVPTDSTIEVNFNEAINTNTITANSFILSDGIEAVAGSYSFSNTDQTAVFTPTENLENNHT
jgi:hypothetical protein